MDDDDVLEPIPGALLNPVAVIAVHLAGYYTQAEVDSLTNDHLIHYWAEYAPVRLGFEVREIGRCTITRVQFEQLIGRNLTGGDGGLSPPLS